MTSNTSQMVEQEQESEQELTQLLWEIKYFCQVSNNQIFITLYLESLKFFKMVSHYTLLTHAFYLTLNNVNT